MMPEAPETCRSNAARWYGPEEESQRITLDAWCGAVGPVAVINSSAGASDGSASLDDVVFVSWNVHVGNGDVERFVADLRSGVLTDGRPRKDVVLLLQEAVRTHDVPPHTQGTKGARRISAPRQRDSDIETLSRSLALSLIYVPSMRNGSRASDPPSDRGNAILSSLPLSDAMAVELPFERQRRVALFARASLSETERLMVGVVHLDALDARRHLWVFRARGWRATQARSLATLLPEGPLVIGADLNTWTGHHEPASEALAQLLMGTATPPARLPARGRALDYLFFRTGSAAARYREAADRYGSDHYPLIGWFSN
jgi:endonuclease/exonuclease/phosphatase family metal-dependent hydrolase